MAGATEQEPKLQTQIAVLSERVEHLSNSFETFGERFDKWMQVVSDMQQKQAVQDAIKANAPAVANAPIPSWSEMLRMNPWIIALALVLAFLFGISMLWIAPKQTVDKIPNAPVRMEQAK